MKNINVNDRLGKLEDLGPKELNNIFGGKNAMEGLLNEYAFTDSSLTIHKEGSSYILKDPQGKTKGALIFADGKTFYVYGGSITAVG